MYVICSIQSIFFFLPEYMFTVLDPYSTDSERSVSKKAINARAVELEHFIFSMMKIDRSSGKRSLF